ncbi:division/cell wall cluster transcriptional repressor MraZ [bacterium]|nr:division/cell wall cluster transcriptional repressor MraZ [bacterium]MBU1882313.1 division/cell wall cluster transcriptional repressor MraZ [bacterium]
MTPTEYSQGNPFPNSFTDEFTYTIDNRGRVNFPAPFRRALSTAACDRVVVARGLDGCLFVFPKDVWEARRREFNQSPYTPTQQRRVQRLLAHGAKESAFDAQGRITIPQRLMELAKLEKGVLIKGMGDRVELWNPDVYDAYLNDSDQTVEAILEEFLSTSPGNLGGSPENSD